MKVRLRAQRLYNTNGDRWEQYVEVLEQTEDAQSLLPACYPLAVALARTAVPRGEAVVITVESGRTATFPAETQHRVDLG